MESFHELIQSEIPILVDFFATWCGPCREELPNVKKVYEKFHSQGFEVLAVSLDQEKEALSENG
jgi:thiol-disulfide isomerase/thioredoxin